VADDTVNDNPSSVADVAATVEAHRKLLVAQYPLLAGVIK
jgi:hypothetical protein